MSENRPDIAELTTHCIRCGFCLEACPTFTTTASELESPRGRIYLVRSALEGRLSWQDDVRPHLDRCLGCKACETACPSGVEYGSILELAREKIDKERPNLAKSLLLKGVTEPSILKINLALGRLMPGTRVPKILSRWVSGRDAEVDRPQMQPTAIFPTFEPNELPPVRGAVYMLEGCAMRVLFPRVHQATRRLLRRVGYEVREVPQACCGSMHAHGGHLEEAETLARNLMQSMPEDLPVIVNSAGCGSTMKHYEFLFSEDAQNTASARAFSQRVFDLSEFLLSEGLTDTLKASNGFETTVTYHDACHLAHGQRIWAAPRELIQAIPGAEYVELVEADTCCGSAGIYNVTEPTIARTLLDRKWQHVAETGASIVATGNPGCHAWIAQAARENGMMVRVLHTAEILEASFSGLDSFEAV